MLVTDVKIGDLINFTLHTNSALEMEYDGAKVLAILDSETARTWIDPIALHTNLFSSLPDGTPNDPDGYSYFKLRLSNGNTTCIGLPWIDETTLEISGRGTLQLEVEDVSSTDIAEITKAIAAVGYRVVNAKIM